MSGFVVTKCYNLEPDCYFCCSTIKVKLYMVFLVSFFNDLL